MHRIADWVAKGGALSRNVYFIVAVFLLLIVASLLLQLTDSRSDDQQMLELLEQGAAQRDSLQEQAERIVDCTEPTGECYKEGQARTAEAVGSINIVSQFAVICGEAVDGEKAILACTTERVKAYLARQEK